MEPLINQKQIIRRLWENTQSNLITVDAFKSQKLNYNLLTGYETSIRVKIIHEPVSYDLYKFLGITFTNNIAEAVPTQYYDANETNTSFTFNLPVYGYAIAQGLDPETELGIGPWEYQTTVSIINTRVAFPNITEHIISKCVIHSFFNSTDGTGLNSSSSLSNFQFLIDPIKEIYTDFSDFYRWLKINENLYELQILGFYPVTNEFVQFETNISFIDRGSVNEVRPNSAKN
jgi:hypothetical protein